jgi:DNA-binding response OmpR family regulator
MERKHKVLVVEDDKMLNKLLCRYVQLAGHSVRSALDGGSAILSAQEDAPTLVLLDLMLPDTTGFEVCTELKRDDRTQSATVIIVTALDDDESRRRGLECGAAEYLLKPFHPDRLMETIKKYAA